MVPCVNSRSLMKCRLKVIITCDLIPNPSFEILFRDGYELRIGREVVGYWLQKIAELRRRSVTGISDNQ